VLIEVGDAIAECLGGVVVGQMAHARSDVQDAYGVGSGRGEGGQLCGEEGQARVSGEVVCRFDDARGPFPDSGLRRFQPVFEVALGGAFGRGVAGWPVGLTSLSGTWCAARHSWMSASSLGSRPGK